MPLPLPRCSCLQTLIFLGKKMAPRTREFWSDDDWSDEEHFCLKCVVIRIAMDMEEHTHIPPRILLPGTKEDTCHNILPRCCQLLY